MTIYSEGSISDYYVRTRFGSYDNLNAIPEIENPNEQDLPKNMKCTIFRTRSLFFTKIYSCYIDRYVDPVLTVACKLSSTLWYETTIAHIVFWAGKNSLVHVFTFSSGRISKIYDWTPGYDMSEARIRDEQDISKSISFYKKGFKETVISYFSPREIGIIHGIKKVASKLFGSKEKPYPQLLLSRTIVNLVLSYAIDPT